MQTIDSTVFASHIIETKLGELSLCDNLHLKMRCRYLLNQSRLLNTNKMKIQLNMGSPHQN